MKNVILENELFAEVLRFNSEYDSFCTVMSCSLLKLHENAELYACVRSGEGTPCKLYISDSHNTVDKNRIDTEDTEWMEAIGGAECVNVYFCRSSASGLIERTGVASGRKTPDIAKTLCRTMDRLSTAHNRVYVITHIKKYDEKVKEEFQKRSVLDLASIDSSGVDIIYFEGADKLIEKLLYGGCRELSVFITDTARAKSIKKSIEKLSRKAPFSNRITVVVGETYAPKASSALLVGNASDMTPSLPAKIFFSVNYAEGEGVGVSVGQNTSDLIPESTCHRLKPFTLHYITSIMSELILHAITSDSYRAKRLFKVNARTLITETIFKED